MSSIFIRERELNRLIAQGIDDLERLSNISTFDNEHHEKQIQLAIKDLQAHLRQWELERDEMTRLIELWTG